MRRPVASSRPCTQASRSSVCQLRRLRRRPLDGTTAEARAGSGGASKRVTVAPFGRALFLTRSPLFCTQQSVDTSDCFERVDLEAKWAKLPPARQQAALDALASLERDSQSTGAQAAKDDGGASSGAQKGGADPFAWPREQLDRLQAFVAEQQRQLASGSWTEGVRAKVEELDSSFNVAARTRMATQKLRDAVLKADAALGVSTAARKYGPPLLRAFNDARATPLGQVFWFLATTWLFLSGAFWTLLSWFFLASLLVNLVAPNWLQNTMEEAIASAMRDAQQAAGGRGAPPPPPPPPRGGSASRPTSGSGGAGGYSSAGRRDLSRDSGPVVDVDADVKDVK